MKKLVVIMVAMAGLVHAGEFSFPAITTTNVYDTIRGEIEYNEDSSEFSFDGKFTRRDTAVDAAGESRVTAGLSCRLQVSVTVADQVTWLNNNGYSNVTEVTFYSTAKDPTTERQMVRSIIWNKAKNLLKEVLRGLQ